MIHRPLSDFIIINMPIPAYPFNPGGNRLIVFAGIDFPPLCLTP